MTLQLPLTSPLVRPLTRRVTDPAWGGWSPRVLFAAGEQGAWYDPSDFSTLFQKSAGTTPVTALGQAVGLMLDKSKGLVLGPELVTNGGFDSDLSGWSVNGPTAATWSAGAAALSRALGNGRFWQDMSGLTVGRMYQASFDVLARSNTLDLAIGVAGTAPSNSFVSGVNAAGTYTGMFMATATSHSVGCILQGSSTATGTIDNFSVRELPGLHASQPTDTARPTLQAGNKIDFDGVDDKLTTTFPDLGTDVTIVRSVPGTGASILTGQTIGAGAWDDSTDHHGLLIINRALTAAETALVTAYMNRKAGV